MTQLTRMTAALHERLAQLPVGHAATPTDSWEHVVLLAQLRALEVLGPDWLIVNWWPLQPDHTHLLGEFHGQQFLAQLSSDATTVALYHVVDCGSCHQGLRVHLLEGAADLDRLLRDDPTGRRTYTCSTCTDRPAGVRALHVPPREERR